MPDQFDLPVWYNSEERFFPAELLNYGTSHKIKVTINDIPVLFEPDEERNYRAVIALEDQDKKNLPKTDLLQVINETIHELLS